MDHYADDLAALIEALDLRDVILVGFSTGGGEVTRYIGRHGTSRVAKLALVTAVPPFMLKTDDNPGGVPIEVFDGPPRRLAHRPLAALPRPRRRAVLRQQPRGRDRRASATPSGARACSPATRTPTTRSPPSAPPTCATTCARVDVPTLVIHGDDDQVVPFAVGGQASRGARPGRAAEGLSGRAARHHRHAQGRALGRPARVRARASGVARRGRPRPSTPRVTARPRTLVAQVSAPDHRGRTRGRLRACSSADRPRTRARADRPAPRRAVGADPARTARGRRQRAGRGRRRAGRGARDAGAARPRGAGRVRLPVRRPGSAPAAAAAAHRGRARPRGCGRPGRRRVRVRRRLAVDRRADPRGALTAPRARALRGPRRRPARRRGAAASARSAPESARSCSPTTCRCSCASGSCARPPATRSR